MTDAQYERNYDAMLANPPEDTRQEVGHCDYCLDDILEGDEAWRDADGQLDLCVCSIGCLAMFTAKYDVDIDEFEKAEAVI